MTHNSVAIIGSGIAATTIAYHLVQKGFHVDIFEKGNDYPYPHTQQFSEEVLYRYKNPKYDLPADLKNHSVVRTSYQHDLEKERSMRVGGSATQWSGNTPRMIPDDFKTKSLFNYGKDWPITYDEIEPYYCRAENFLGISGTTKDNPFAPWRSEPYPLPPFEFGYDDNILAERLKKNTIHLHTTPQARLSQSYNGRDACVNFGTCAVCPMGARYSPNYHLQKAIDSGLCRVHTNVSVRRIIVDKTGKVQAIFYSENDSKLEKEFAADLIILAAGALESIRLLLLSHDSNNPDGLGNQNGQLGKNFSFHHLWSGGYKYKEPLYPGRIGPYTGQCQQFINPETRGKHGGIKIEFSSGPGVKPRLTHWGDSSQIYEELKPLLYSRKIIFHSESIADNHKRVGLSDKRDRFGDPFAKIYYGLNELDHETYSYAKELFDRFALATGGDKMFFHDVEEFQSGAHHMGGCSMGADSNDGVVDKQCKLHSSPNLFLAGSSVFVGPSGSSNPTLTITALAIRLADYIVDQFV